MGQLNIKPVQLTTTVADLLNGAFASLSGPVGFVPKQPRIHVRGVSVSNPSTTTPVDVGIYKGSSGLATGGTELVTATLNVDSTVFFPINTILDAADFITGKCRSSGTLVVALVADIEF